MQSHQFVVSVMGSFDQELLKSFIKMTEKKLEELEADESIKKRIFHFVVECAQNLCNKNHPEQSSVNNLFLIGKKNNNYIIHLGSVYSKADSRNISSIIDSVNKMEKSEIREKFFDELATKDFTKQNHFLMSVLDLSRRTRNKINYEIFDINEITDFFTFNTSIVATGN